MHFKEETVSVIIPNFNHAQFLERRLDSVVNQTYAHFEIIILDDCSTDKSREVIEPYRNHSRISHIIYNDRNSGSPFKQWLKGIELAKGKWIWIAESDDFCDQNFLTVAVQKLNETKADLFYCKSVRVDENSNGLDEMEWWYNDLQPHRWEADYVNSALDEAKNYLARKCTIVNASAVVFENRKELPNYLSQLSRFRSCGDWLFWLMYLHNSEKITYSIETSNYFRSHSATTRANVSFARNFEVLRIYKWVCENVLNERESLRTISYYFSVHLRFHSRKKILQNIRFVFQSFKYTTLTFWFLIKYYLQVKLFAEGAKQL